MSTLTVRLSDDTHHRLKELARSRGVSLNKLMEELLTIAVTQHDTEASLPFSPPDGRSTRYGRHDFVALACRAQRTVKYACARQAARASS